MADLQAHIGRGGFERARIMPASTLTLERNVPAENVKVSHSQVISGGTPVFFDDFDYAVARSDANYLTAFTGAGWTGGKAENAGDEPGANGWLYTVTSIAGFAGTFPGSSSRALCLEAGPVEGGGQTDFFLQYGSQADDIPGNVWFQFWIYPQNFDTQLSAWGNRNKFLYVTRDTYPSGENNWMVGDVGLLYSPNVAPVWPWGEPLGSQFAWSLSDGSGGTTINYSPSGTPNKLSPQVTTPEIEINQWTLVKMHMDTTGANGTWEMWLKPQGGSFTKVAEWIGGTTPDFTWTIPLAQRGGHLALRMPTTVGHFAGQPEEIFGYFMYMQDFTIAGAEADLPTY